MKAYADELRNYTDDLLKENGDLRKEASSMHDENEQLRVNAHELKKAFDNLTKGDYHIAYGNIISNSEPENTKTNPNLIKIPVLIFFSEQ